MNIIELGCRAFHAPADFVIRGADAIISVSVIDIPGDFKAVLYYTDARGSRISVNMKPADAYESCGKVIDILSATIPAKVFDKKNTLDYSIVIGDIKKLGDYSVSVCDRSEYPPFIITEMFIRPKGNKITAYVEIANISDKPTDLFDYKLMTFNGTELTDDISVSSMSIVDYPKREILKPGEIAVLWFVTARAHKLEDGRYSDINGFFDMLEAEDFRDGQKFDRENIRVIPIELTEKDENGEYVAKKDIFEFNAKPTTSSTVLIVPRGKTVADAVYKLIYNDIKFVIDSPVFRSSYWTADVRDMSRAVRIINSDYATPGTLYYRQALPNTAEELPVIIPLCGESFYYKDGELEVGFGVVAEKVTEAKVHYRLPDGSFTAVDAYENDNGIFVACIDKRTVVRLTKLDYYITVKGSVYQTSLGGEAQTLSIKLIDNAGPEITGFIPEKGYCFEKDDVQTISCSYYDISGMNLSDSRLYIDGKDITDKALWLNDRLSYTPEKPLKAGEHKIDFVVFDNLGNRTYLSRAFAVSDCKDEDMNFYHGEVHSHTGDSDGVKTPFDAMTYARDVGGVDFFAVTDHSHYETAETYKKLKTVADSLNEPGKFAALYGYEMTWNYQNGWFGHMNVINSDNIVQDINEVTQPQLYEILKNDKNAIAMFNHPGLIWGNFIDYANYSKEIDDKICLTEIKGLSYDREYMSSLAKGWHATPVFNEDNHAANWTTATTGTGYIVAPALTRANVLEAFRKHRTYTTLDPTIKILYKINGEWMGARLDNPSKLEFEINITTENEAGIGKICLIGEDNIIVETFEAGAAQNFGIKFKMPPMFDYYYLRIISPTQLYTVTAPVWIEGRKPLKAARLRVVTSEEDYLSQSVRVCIENNGEKTIKNLTADFYLTGVGGFDINTAIPYDSVRIGNGSIKPGMKLCAVRNFPISGYKRLSVIISGKCGRETFTDTKFVMLTPVVISEVLPKSSPEGEFENPYPFIKLKNLTNREFSLGGGLIRLWTNTGKAPVEERSQKTDGMKISPRGEIAIWIKPVGSSLTVADFNKRYGTEYVEGEDIFITEKRIVSSSKHRGRRIELVCGGEVISRVHYNYGVAIKHEEIKDDVVLKYVYRQNMTGTSTKKRD